MFRKALVGCVATCVCAVLGLANILASASDIVLYAGDATNLRGNWTRVADSSAAGGQMLTSADRGWANTVGSQASPSDSFDFVFTAPAATTYHVWMRMRAQGNSKYNDSAFAQFSDAVDGYGAALFSIGTTNGLAVNLADSASAGSLGGWGWQDRAYWLSQPVTLRFASSGTHTLRIQTREDGVQIDQVVLSAGAYLTAAPGPVSNDTTIVAKPVTVTALPTPWSNQDVGATGLASSVSLASGTFTAAGSGADIWGTTDGFQFVSQPVNGDTQIVARVATIQNTNSYAKAGVMLRESTGAGAAHVLLDVRPNGSVEFMSRPSNGASTNYIAGGTQSLPGWLKLTRSGTTVTGWVSANGTVWTQIGTTSIAMTGTLAGLAITSHDTTLLNTSTLDSVIVGLPPAAPFSPTPNTGAAGVSTTASVTWSGAATSYDVRFGTTNPPALVATALTSGSYAPAAMANGTTYFWQIIARNAAGSTAGPVWSFSTLVPAPTTPVPTSPAAGSTNIATSTTLAWSATNATSYDVAFGTTNPPATVATNLAMPAFAPPALVNGATYYWQVTAKNAGGATAGPVSSFTTIIAAPGTPTPTTPTDGATGVALASSLAWSAAAATSYDVAFGTTNPPATVATNLATPAFAPPALVNGATYYWQVTAKNAGGATAGPVSSFTTIIAAPGTPTPTTPVNGATAVALTSSLAWSAANATSYDVAFGTTNPPATVATNLAMPAFAPPTLVNGATYYWQVTAKNAGGETAGLVSSFTTIIAAPVIIPTDIVLYAGDASSYRGNWALVADSTAAGGQAMSSVDKAWANTSGPLAAPADFFEFTFSAPAGTPYHVWMRMRAAANSKYNDSVFAQFSDAIDRNNAALYRLDTTNGLTVNLATDAAAGSLNGWGWQDRAYWLTQATTIAFAADGTHTMRIQTREDGASIDQIVLSSVTFLTTAPGSPTNDPTIVAKAAATVPPTPTTGAPTTYRALADRTAYAKPALPALGAAGYSFNDPTFASRILRVTDGNTRPGVAGRSYRVASNAHLAAWNATSTAFFVMSNDGTSIPFAFDPATMAASRIQPSSSGNGGFSLAFYVEPQFSLVNPNAIFGAVSGSNNRTISQYDFSTGVYSTIVDLDTIASGLAGTYVGGLMTGGTPAENLMMFFGGGSQDNHYLALWLPLGNLGGRKLVNTVGSTINGAPTSTVLNFHLHSAQIDKGGRYVFLYPTAADLAAPRSAAQVYLWDTVTDTFTSITASMKSSGHDAAGYGYWINQDCCTSSSWDAAQWQFRSLASVVQTSDLISPVLATKEVFMADHTSWNNAQASTLVPVISSTYRYGDNTVAWRAWDDEIIGIDTTSGIGGMVYRFAHHRSDVRSDANPLQPYFWYEPIANVSPNGRWVLFTSNWEKTLGRDSSEGTFRQDVFIVQLTSW